MSRWRVAARVARREARRHWARSALVVAIIAVPVLGAQAAALLWGSVERNLGDGESIWDPQFAGADEVTGFDPRLGRPPAVEGAEEVVVGFSIWDWTPSDGHGTGPDDLQRLRVVGFVPGRSEVALHEGREPRTRHEAVVTADLAAEAGVGIGDRVEVVASEVELTVVGISSRRDGDGATAWAGPPLDAADDWVPDALARIRDSGSDLVSAEMFDLTWLTPEARAAWARDLDPEEFDAPTSRLPDRDRVAQAVVWAAALTIAVGFIATTASSAFAIGARRQVRQLGILAATGAAPSDLLRAVVLQGTVLGLVAAAVATVVLYLGRAVAVAVWLRDEGWVVPLQVPWALAAAALGVVAGTAAAAVPAFTASRVPVLSALAGARPRRRRPLRSPWAGAVAVGVGLVGLSWAARRGAGGSSTLAPPVAALSVLAVMAGAVAVSPGLVALVARLSAPARGTVRLAGRTLARDGMRSAAVVASTAVALSIPAIGLVGMSSTPRDEAGPETSARQEQVAAAYAATTWIDIGGPAEPRDAVVEEVRAIVDDDAVAARAVVVRLGGVQDDVFGSSSVVDPDQLRAVTGDDEVADALDAGAVVRLGDTDWAETTWSSPGGPGEPWLDRVDADVVEVEADGLAPVTLGLLNESPVGITAARPAETIDAGWVRVGVAHRLAPDVVRRVERLGTGADSAVDRATLAALAPSTGSIQAVGVSVDRNGSYSSDVPWGPISFAAAVIVALLVIGTASALAAADGREDARLVAAVGAPPTTVRRRRALEATFTAAAAAVLGVGLGSVAAALVLRAPGALDDLGLPMRPFPVLSLLGVAVGSVVVIGAVTWACLATADLLRGRRDLVLEG